MYCIKCGKKLPEGAIFCLYCGEKVPIPEEESAQPEEPGPSEGDCVQVFTYPPETVYDQASKPVTAWLEEGGRQIVSASFDVEPTLVAGMVAPAVNRIEICWREDAGSPAYQMGVMLDSVSDFGMSRKKKSVKLSKQFDRWKREHPDYEVAGMQECSLAIGWTSAWCTLFFFR